MRSHKINMDAKHALRIVESTYANNHFQKPSKLNYILVAFSFIALFSGLAALLYVLTNVYKFREATTYSSKLLYGGTHTITDVNWHYICIGATTLTLPDPTNYNRGSFVSVNASNPLDNSSSTVVTVNNFANLTTTTVTNTGLFIVVDKSGVYKWKRIK